MADDGGNESLSARTIHHGWPIGCDHGAKWAERDGMDEIDRDARDKCLGCAKVCLRCLVAAVVGTF